MLLHEKLLKLVADRTKRNGISAKNIDENASDEALDKGRADDASDRDYGRPADQGGQG